MSSKTRLQRRAELLFVISQPAPLDNKPKNRTQRRQAEKFLRRIQRRDKPEGQ